MRVCRVVTCTPRKLGRGICKGKLTPTLVYLVREAVRLRPPDSNSIPMQDRFIDILHNVVLPLSMSMNDYFPCSSSIVNGGKQY